MTKKWASVHPKNRIYKIQFGNLYNPMIDISRLLLYSLINLILKSGDELKQLQYEILCASMQSKKGGNQFASLC